MFLSTAITKCFLIKKTNIVKPKNPLAQLSKYFFAFN